MRHTIHWLWTFRMWIVGYPTSLIFALPVRPEVAEATHRGPRCDLLDQPHIAVGISEGEERPVAIALGVGAGKPCLQGKRCAVPHLTRVDATAAEFAMSRSDVGDNQRRRARARRRRSESVAEGNRAS